MPLLLNYQSIIIFKGSMEENISLRFANSTLFMEWREYNLIREGKKTRDEIRREKIPHKKNLLVEGGGYSVLIVRKKKTCNQNSMPFTSISRNLISFYKDAC